MNILFLDDDNIQLEIYRLATLKISSVYPVYFNNPQDALTYLNDITYSDSLVCGVDAIVTDFTMPVMNGSEFARKAIDVFYGPIICHTSNYDVQDPLFNRVFVKPTTTRKLVECCRNYLPDYVDLTPVMEV